MTFIHEKQDLELYSVSDWQPMKFFQYWHYVVILLRAFNQACCSVLEALKFIRVMVSRTVQYAFLSFVRANRRRADSRNGENAARHVGKVSRNTREPALIISGLQCTDKAKETRKQQTNTCISCIHYIIEITQSSRRQLRLQKSHLKMYLQRYCSFFALPEVTRDNSVSCKFFNAAKQPMT